MEFIFATGNNFCCHSQNLVKPTAAFNKRPIKPTIYHNAYLASPRCIRGFHSCRCCLEPPTSTVPSSQRSPPTSVPSVLPAHLRTRVLKVWVVSVVRQTGELSLNTFGLPTSFSSWAACGDPSCLLPRGSHILVPIKMNFARTYFKPHTQNWAVLS